MSVKEKFFKDIKIVGFDFDDTLVNEQYFIKTRWEKVLKKYSFIAPRLEKIFFKIYSRKGPSYKFHLDDALKELNTELKIKERILSELRKANGDEMLLKGATYIVKTLKNRGFKVGIITDGTSLRQEKRIKKTGLYKFMDFIFYGNSNEEKKPNKKVIKEIFGKFKIKSPEQFLYVGNDFFADIKGMLSIGTKACWVTNKRSVSNNPNLIKVKDLNELLNKFNHE